MLYNKKIIIINVSIIYLFCLCARVDAFVRWVLKKRSFSFRYLSLMCIYDASPVI